MIVDLNELAGQFARALLTVDAVYHTIRHPNEPFYEHTGDRLTPKAGFLFAIRGHTTFAFNGTSYEMSPGTVVHGGKQMELRIAPSADEFEFFLIHYTPNYKQLAAEAELPTDYMQTHFALEPGEHPKLIERLRQLHQASRTPGNLAAIRTKELFHGILHELFAYSRNRLHSESGSSIEQAIAYIQDHFMEPLTVGEMAARYGMEAKPFAYLFTKFVGISPIDYLIHHRMKRAEELLTTSRCTIGEIAVSVGYGDAHYFSRLYKKHTGLSPTEFRSLTR
ncbi:helix-turn-helix domain-containing protein [Paenibacillus hemerocallicola]|uniref:Helix-turn-helix domain-containing protein n=1 Tax=Paenibacillus hemerocallicola TaxID=1172614 RepID=A0A5C4TCU8_9BACL|nr:AraC family transcriptional regulator [Paenibacillus hemerocallicola]TNJ66456.1 helix-turn-helix domain-containing protein [Paenibacillus hemerocallicola]